MTPSTSSENVYLDEAEAPAVGVALDDLVEPGGGRRLAQLRAGGLDRTGQAGDLDGRLDEARGEHEHRDGVGQRARRGWSARPR